MTAAPAARFDFDGDFAPREPAPGLADRPVAARARAFPVM